MRIADSENAGSVSKGMRHRSLLGNVSGKFELVADPDDPFLKSGALIQVTGIGRKFSGTYKILKITHDLTNGYKYKVEAQRNAVQSTNDAAKANLNGPINDKLPEDDADESIDMPILDSDTLEEDQPNVEEN